MHKIDIAGLKIDAIAKKELLDQLAARLRGGQKTFVTTPYSEFLYRSLHDGKVRELLNSSDYAVADGIGIFWACAFLSIPLSTSSYYGKIIQAFLQAVYSGAAILLHPSWVKKALPEKIPGSDLVWDLAELCTRENKSIFLLGGFGDTPKEVAQKLVTRHPQLSIAGYSNKSPDDPGLIDDIKRASPDAIFVAYGPIRQEQWIAAHKDELPAVLFIGLGGTFDYIAGKRISPPKFIRSIGLEWLYRLVTQPYRIRRIYQATLELIMSLIRYKVFHSLPFRRNAVAVVLNKKYEVLVVRYNPAKPANKILAYPPHMFDNWWQMPQGGVDDGEDVIEGAKRELWEETSIRNVSVLGTSKENFEYYWETQRVLLIRKRYRFCGQRQTLVYFLFTGENKEIVLDWDESLEYKWVPWQELDKILSKKELAHIAQKELSAGLVKLP